MLETKITITFYVLFIIISLINIISGYILIFHFTKYNRKVKGILGKVENVSRSKKRNKYKMGFLYTIYGREYYRLSEQILKKKDIDKYIIGEAYPIYVQNHFPTSFIVKRRISDIIIGFLFIFLGAFYLISLIVLNI